MSVQTPTRQRPRRPWIVALTYLLGTAAMAWSLHIPAGDATFYLATAVLGSIWLVGSVLAGRSRWVSENTPDHPGGWRRDLTWGLVTGLVLLVVFLLGASLIVHVPFLREPVDALLAHAAWGALPVVTLILVVNGVTEEIFFRGALMDALRGHRPIVTSTILYALATATSGILLLVLAGVMLGAACAWLRQRTDALVAPVLAHLTWSTGMLYLLPPTLDLWR